VRLLARESCCGEDKPRAAGTTPESRQMAFGRRRTGPLHGHSKDHLAYGWPLRGGAQSTCLIDPLDQIQLLSDPHQRSHISDAARADRAHGCQVGHRWRIGGTQDGLVCEGTLANGIPHRLGGDSVPSSAHHPLENINSFI
jgi:hypothetical protein